MMAATLWEQNYTPVAGSLGLSALVAALPIFTLLVLLGVLRKPAWMASVAGWRRPCWWRPASTECRWDRVVRRLFLARRSDCFRSAGWCSARSFCIG